MTPRICQLIASLVAVLATGSMAWSLAPMPSRAQALLHQRDQLQQELLRADEAAADALLRGEDPVELHADQTGLQEQVDMMQMRLESLAMRFEVDIPALATTIEQFDPAIHLDPYIAIGRQRTRVAMSRQCEAACDLIISEMDFNVFLDF